MKHGLCFFCFVFTTKEDGHGLGLVNCRKIIKNHKGEIKLSSTEGEGTTFTVILPAGEETDLD